MAGEPLPSSSFATHPIHGVGLPEIHVQEIQTVRYVVDVEMELGQYDQLEMTVHYSDGSRKVMAVSVPTGSGRD